MGISVLLLLFNFPQAEASLCNDEVFLEIKLGDVLVHSDSGIVEFSGGFEFLPDVFVTYTVFCDGLIQFDYSNNNFFPIDVPAHSFWFTDLMWTDQEGKVVDFIIEFTETNIMSAGFSDTSVHAINNGFTIAEFDNFAISDLQIVSAHQPVGGEFIPLDSTMVLVAGAQYTAAWMFPIIVAAAGFGLLIQTQKTRLKNTNCPNCKSETDDTFELGEKLVGKCTNSKCRVSLFFVK